MALRNYVEADIDSLLPRLFKDLLTQGQAIGSRNGSTRELPFTNITLIQPHNREITLPSRKANVVAQIAETMWVLAGRNDIEWLSHYLPRAADFSDDGLTWRAGYGPRLRTWINRDGDPVDQLARVVELLKADPRTRRAVISLFDPALDFTESKDIPCNNWLHFLSRDGVLNLHVAVRSNDAMWGWSGINAFEWSVLLEIVASLTDLEIGALHFSVSSMHLYERHWDKAERITRDVAVQVLRSSPLYAGRSLINLDHDIRMWFDHEQAIRTGRPLPSLMIGTKYWPTDPMLSSWLRVLQWWWSGGDLAHLRLLEGTRLYEACLVGVQPPKPKRGGLISGASDEVPVTLQRGEHILNPKPSPFIEYVCKLHDEKDAGYGTSWKKRGEMLGIMANIARKIDRLGQNSGGETAADTAIDLLVYLAKYRWWLFDHHDALSPIPSVLGVGPGEEASDGTAAPNALLRYLDRRTSVISGQPVLLEQRLTQVFSYLEKRLNGDRATVPMTVDVMLRDAYQLARQLWETEQK